MSWNLKLQVTFNAKHFGNHVTTYIQKEENPLRPVINLSADSNKRKSTYSKFSNFSKEHTSCAIHSKVCENQLKPVPNLSVQYQTKEIYTQDSAVLQTSCLLPIYHTLLIWPIKISSGVECYSVSSVFSMTTPWILSTAQDIHCHWPIWRNKKTFLLFLYIDAWDEEEMYHDHPKM